MKKVTSFIFFIFLFVGWGDLYAERIRRIHITIEPGIFISKGTSGLKEIYKNWGFGDYESVTVLGFVSSRTEYRSYPLGESKIFFFPKNLKIEYSISKNFDLGFIFSRLGRYKVQGYKQNKWGIGTSGIHMTGEFQGNAYHFTVAFKPFSRANIDTAPFKAGAGWLKVGAGLGMSVIDLKFVIGETSDLSKNILSFIAFAGYDVFFSRQFTFGIDFDYKYVPFTINAFQIAESLIIDFSEQKVNFGGFGVGINLGLHF